MNMTSAMSLLLLFVQLVLEHTNTLDMAEFYLMLTDAASVNVVMVVDATVCPDDELRAVQCFRPIHLQSLAAYETKVQILELRLIAQNLFHKPQKKKSYIK